MNLLFVHERLGSFGGAESNLFATAVELHRRGHRLGLLTREATGPQRIRLESFFRRPHLFRLGEDPVETAARTFPVRRGLRPQMGGPAEHGKPPRQ